MTRPLTRGQREDLKTLLRHAKADLAYGWGGSYGGGDEGDKNGGMDVHDIKRARRAIAYLEALLASE